MARKQRKPGTSRPPLGAPQWAIDLQWKCAFQWVTVQIMYNRYVRHAGVCHIIDLSTCRLYNPFMYCSNPFPDPHSQDLSPRINKDLISSLLLFVVIGNLIIIFDVY